MQFSLTASLLALLTLTSGMALETRQNANRPVANGACCVANTSLKQDVCNVNGQSGRCVPAAVNGCGERLTCIEDSRLNCNPAVLERGRPLCRLQGDALVL